MKKGLGVLLGIGALVWAQSLRILDEEGQPVSSVQVLLQPQPKGAPLRLFTDSLGGIEAPAGSYRISAQAEGFVPVQAEIVLPAPLPLTLERPAYTLTDNIITAQYAPVQELRSLYPVRILTPERLQAQGALYLPQVLATELNTRLEQDPTLGTFATLQGLGGEQVKILLDGVPVLGRVSGSMDLSQLPLSEVERVEIVEGPMSVLYGTDAMGGVINLITRSSRCQWEARSRFQYEGIGVYDAGLTVAGGSTKHRIALSVGRYFFDGWDPDSDRPRAQLWRPRLQYNALATYQYRPSDRFRLRIQLPFGDETFFNRKEPTITPYRIYALDEYYYTRRLMPAFETHYRLSPSLHWHQQGALLYYRRVRNVVYKDLVSLSETLVPLEGQQDSTEEYQFWARGGLYHKGNYGSLQLGHELQHSIITGGRIREGRAEVGDYALWGTAEWALSSQLALQPGFRWAYNTRYRAPLLPALHLRWNPTSSLTWRIGYSRGFRAPSLREQFLYLVFTNHNLQGNPNLRPERSHHVHTNLTWQQVKATRLWRLRLSAFYNTVEDLIQLVIVEPATLFTTYYNLQRFQTLGLQPRAELRRQNFHLMTGATFTQYRGERWGWEAVLQTGYTYRSTTFHAFFKYQGLTPIFIADESGGAQWGWIGGFPWLDLSVSRNLLRGLSATVGMRNALNVRSVQAGLAGGVHTGGVSSPVGMGRYPFVRIEYHLQKGQL